MSADNEIAIVRFNDKKYGVGMVRGCPSVNNIVKYLPRGKEFLDEFQLFDTEEGADKFARQWEETLNKSDYVVEYGVTDYTVDLPSSYFI